jgi:DNA adenine methylase
VSGCVTVGPAERFPRRPALRYHGGKWNLAPWLISLMPPHRIYVEPFAGAASVLLRKPRVYSEIINDLDGDVVNLFRVLRDEESASRLIRALELTPFAREEFNLAQGGERDARGHLIGVIDPVERARHLVVRSHMGFGSDSACGRPYRTGFRANGHRSGTTPGHDWANLPEALRAVAERLRGVVIENRAALEVIAQQDRGDVLFYVDPPYLGSTRQRCHRKGSDTYRHEMASEEEHRELAETLRGVAGAVIVSGYPSPLYEEIYAGWWREERPSLADGARKRLEVVWMNRPPAQGRLPQ